MTSILNKTHKYLGFYCDRKLSPKTEFYALCWFTACTLYHEPLQVNKLFIVLHHYDSTKYNAKPQARRTSKQTNDFWLPLILHYVRDLINFVRNSFTFQPTTRFTAIKNISKSINKLISRLKRVTKKRVEFRKTLSSSSYITYSCVIRCNVNVNNVSSFNINSQSVC